MFRKVIAFIVLICHVNSSMFLPQGAEQDIFGSLGQQQDDVNTVIEYIDKLVMGKHLEVPQDTDDDSGQNFHLVKEVNYYYEPFFSEVEQAFTESKAPRSFAAYREQKITAIAFEIVSPPPDAC